MMQWVETEIDLCLNYEEGGTCLGAGGGRLRRVCVWCPNYRKPKTDQHSEKIKEESDNNAGR